MVEKTVKKQVVELLQNYVAKVAAHVQNTVKSAHFSFDTVECGSN